MLVTLENFQETVERLSGTRELACDTETTSLHAYNGGSLFAVIFADDKDEYYFDFNPDSDGVPLPRSYIARLQPIFELGEMYGHNFKFDWHFLGNEGITIRRNVWCTEAIARVVYNEHLSYSLAACGERIGVKKDERVKEYLDANKLYEWHSSPGKKSREKRYFFNRVPLDIIVPYGCRDARVTYELAKSQKAKLQELDSGQAAPSLAPVVENERQITRVFYHMERTGIRIDRAYCQRAWEYEQDRAAQARRSFLEISGHPLLDSRTGLKAPFSAAGIEPGKTEKGNDSFTDDVLSKYSGNLLVDQILIHRDAMKRANTYFGNFLKLADKHDRIHTNLRQAGAATGRTAAREPNLQNVTERDDSQYPVKRAFIADDDSWLVELDYSQQEYRLMLDYAGEMDLIAKVAGGADVHQATADTIFEMTGVRITRSAAKNINFALLYGAGIGKLALMLGVSYDEAALLKMQYFRALRKVEKFISSVVQKAERRGYIFNWFGRRCWVPDPRFAYKMPNYLIQGGGADIMKVGLVGIDAMLGHARVKSKLILTVHDSALLSIHRSERHLVEESRQIMKKAYPEKHLPMECSVSYSEQSWFDMKEGMPA